MLVKNRQTRKLLIIYDIIMVNFFSYSVSHGGKGNGVLHENTALTWSIGSLGKEDVPVESP